MSPSRITSALTVPTDSGTTQVSTPASTSHEWDSSPTRISTVAGLVRKVSASTVSRASLPDRLRMSSSWSSFGSASTGWVRCVT